jgi:hypothetical protein
MAENESVKRVAMWSGPRNLSTAMMYAFAQRSDCTVTDEPFYAAYLQETGLTHPMRKEIIAAGNVNPNAVIAACLSGNDDSRPLRYQKHMTQHMLPQFDRSWLAKMTNIFLIRHPARVLVSYDKKRDNPTLMDIGFPQQVELVDLVTSLSGAVPIIVDSADIRSNPAGMLRLLCEKIGVPFDDAMLSWPKGGNIKDGVWAPHWYNAVWNSTGFAGAESPIPELALEQRALLGDAMALYKKMKRFKICV